MKENKKISKKGLFVIFIGLLLIGIGCVLFFTSSSKNEKTSNNDDNKKIEEIDDAIKEILYKYHGGKAGEKIELFGFLDSVYNSDKYDIRELSYEELLADFNIIVLKNTVKVLNDNSKDALNKKEIITKTLEKEFEKFFGKNAKKMPDDFDIDDSCSGIGFFEDSYDIDNRCEGTTDKSVVYNLIKIEKDNNYLYIFESATVTSSLTNEEKVVTYKWTYDLQDDNNYYLLRIDKQ